MPTTTRPGVGDPAPDLAAATDVGDRLTLAPLRGRAVVLVAAAAELG